jgi:hypothetical protein
MDHLREVRDRRESLELLQCGRDGDSVDRKGSEACSQ